MSIQARPKYTIEEYPLVFPFDANVTGTPSFTVELLTGIDPNKDDIVGLYVVSRNLVAVFISGGVAGCIYRITCLADGFEEDAILAVLPTAAQPPPGGNIPFTFRVNTLPYPVIYYDEVSLDFSVLGGVLETLVVQANVEDDDVTLGFGVVSGYLSPPPVGEFNDDVDLEFAVLSGALYEAPAGDVEDDNVDINFAVMEGALSPAPTGTFEDFVDLSFGVIGGSLNVP